VASLTWRRQARLGDTSACIFDRRPLAPQVGRPQVGDLTVGLPLSSAVMKFLRPLNAGTIVSSLSVEKRLPGEAAGHCALQLDLTGVRVADLTYGDGGGAAQQLAELSLSPLTERVTNHPADGGTRSVAYDVANNLVTADTGTVAADATATFTASLDSPNVTFGIDSWHHAIAQTATGTSGSGGAGAGKAEHAPVTVAVRGNRGATIDLLARLLRASLAPDASLGGCGQDSCTQEIALETVAVSKVELSTTTSDPVDLTYAAISWSRTDSFGQVADNWSVVRNSTF
jgi:type VI protein secretion system component Hcp